MTDNPLNAQQLQQIQANAEKSVRQILEQMQLRKWAVEQAFTLISSCNQSTIGLLDDGGQPVSVMGLVESIYKFVNLPSDLKINLSP